MNGYVTDTRFNRVLNLPIAMAQTELRAGANLLATVVELNQGQRLEIRSLTINVVRVLTSGVVPILNYDAYGLANVGLYYGLADCTPIVYTSVLGNNAATANPFRRYIVTAPGIYRIVVKNNASNADLSVVACGAMKLYC